MLNYNDLYNGFLSIMDNTDGYSENWMVVAQQWTKVFQTFYMNQILPIPGAANPNLFPSLQIFSSGFIAAAKNQVLKEQFEVLVQILHLGICTGVTMTGLYATTPPAAPLKLQHCFNSNFPTKVIANLLAMQIFIWVQTTFSIQTSSGAIVKWV